MDKLNQSLDKLIKIYSEYNIFRLQTNFNYNSTIATKLYSKYGLNFDELLHSYNQELNTDKPSANFMSFFEEKFAEYFKYFLIQFNGEVAGQASIEHYKDTIVTLHRVYVRPEFRGNHLSKLLLQKIIEVAKDDNFTSIYLDTLPILTSALRLYKNIGFKRIPYYEIPDLTPEIAEGFKSIFMEYSLQS